MAELELNARFPLVSYFASKQGTIVMLTSDPVKFISQLS